MPADSITHSIMHAVDMRQYVDTLSMPMLQPAGIGVEGDPLPYRLADDSSIILIEVLCMLFFLAAYTQSWRMWSRMIKGFFHAEGPARITTTPDSLAEQHFQWVAVAGTITTMATILYFAAHDLRLLPKTDPPSLLYLFTFIGGMTLYFCVKACMYLGVNWVFFESKKNEQWLKAWLFITAIEGILTYPLLLIYPHIGISPHVLLISILIIVFFIKILTFYRSYIIFFRRSGNILHIILYFCALEMTPLAICYGLMVLYDNKLTIIF